MNLSRPVIAFALLSQSSEAMHTDLLGGVSLLVRPLIGDLAGQIYDAGLLTDRMAKAYGMSLPASALEEFLPRLVSAGILRTEESAGGLVRAFYCESPTLDEIKVEGTAEFQSVIDDFLFHAGKLLGGGGITINQDVLVSSFLRHLSTLDFSSIKARPLISESEPGTTLEGPAAKEARALSAELKNDAAIDVIIASYIANLSTFDPSKLAMLSKVADGALGLELVLDLQAPTSVPRISNTTAIIDTPLLLAFLDLSEKAKTDAARKLISQLSQAGAKIAAFQHSIDEAEGILAAIQSARHVGEAYGPTVARLANSVYRRYFDSMINRIATAWKQTNNFELIQETATAFYKNFTQDDEEQLTQRLRFSLADRRLTRERDAKSVAETIRRLGGAHIPIGNLAACKYFFITGNISVQSRAAKFLRERKFIKSGEVMPIMTDRYVTGLCWLISGGKSETSPSTAQLLANCASALRMKPEIADRTKKFLSGLDEEKAKHFEALMTNERASQYVMEVAVGDLESITGHNVEEIYYEAQRRAAELVAKEKDEEYGAIISNLTDQLQSKENRLDQLQQEVTSVAMDRDASMLQSKAAVAKTLELEDKSKNQTSELQRQSADIEEMRKDIKQLADAGGATAAELNRLKSRSIDSASRFANGRVKLVRWGGCLLMFAAAAFLGYVDKFILPSLSVKLQPYGNGAVVILQSVLGIFGVAILFDFVVGRRLVAWRNQLYNQKLLELGVVLDDSQILDGAPVLTGIQEGA